MKIPVLSSVLLLSLVGFVLFDPTPGGADDQPRTFGVWATSCSHVPADIKRGRESLGDAIRQSEGEGGFHWDVMIDAGDLSASQFPPIDEDGEELQIQYRALTRHRREQIYNVPGNHDAPYYDHGPGSWFRKWGDPMGENTEFSGVDPKRRPFPVEGNWERYRFQAGNLLFLMLSDRNDAPTPVGRGHSREKMKGGYPPGAVTRETFEWWKKQVLENQDKLIITMHHHALRDTTTGSGNGEGHPRYHGASGGAAGSSYLYYLIENDDPDDFRYTSDAHVFEDFLAEFHDKNGRGAIDFWIGGHTHMRGPTDNFGNKTITETRWGVNFLQAAGLTKHHAGGNPLSRLLTFTGGKDEVLVRTWLHDSSFRRTPVGFFEPATRTLKLRHRFTPPPPIEPMEPFPASARVFERKPKPRSRTNRSTPPSASRVPGTGSNLITERNVDVPMRDGTLLRADLFRPAAPGRYPVLVTRTPYNKNGRHAEAKKFADAGYIVVCQDARGRFASDGQWESFLRFDTNDGRDGYDTVEWAAKLPGSTGKVGTFGASYNAFLQWRTAALAPPSLVCMSAHSIPARYTDLEGMGSIKPGRRLQWWYGSMTPDLRKRSGNPGTQSNADGKKLWREESEQWLHFLPWIDLPTTFWEEETNAVHAWLQDPSLDPWALHQGIPQMTVPNLNAIGWFDHCNGNLLLDTETFARAKTEIARTRSHTIVGPWSHTGRGGRKVGTIDFGPEAAVNLHAVQLKWFDYWLKGNGEAPAGKSPYRIFVMGDGVWRDEPAWPLERAVTKSLFLTSGGKANTPAGDGRLVMARPHRQAKDEFAYDPKHPAPTLYSAAAFTVPADQSPLADRQDILVYQSDPLTERMEVTGNPVVELFASTSAPDTDFFVRLINVSPDGSNFDVSLGMIRARYRNGLENPELVEPGKVVRYQIEMNPTSISFLPGHRIRLDITSSDFPNFDRNHNTAANPNTDAELRVANQSIFTGGETATVLKLPTIPE